MIHHNQLEKFVSRGLKAQRAVAQAIERAHHQLPSEKLAGAGESLRRSTEAPLQELLAVPTSLPPGGEKQRAGGSSTISPPRGPSGLAPQGELLFIISHSRDEKWLKGLMIDRDQTAAVRQAAQKRLRKLIKRPRL